MKKLIILFWLIPAFVMAQDLSKIKLQDLDGKEFAMKNNLDHDATLVLFWATWCLPCKKEFPGVQALLEKYKDKDIEVIAVSKDSPRSLAKVKSFVRTHKFDFTYVIDSKGDVSTKLLINSIPYTMLLDKAGKAVYTHRGYRLGDEKELEEELKKLWESQKKTVEESTE